MPKWILVALTELGIAVVYSWMAWFLIEWIVILPVFFEIPTLVIKVFAVLLLLGLPIKLVFAWRPISRRVN